MTILSQDTRIDLNRSGILSDYTASLLSSLGARVSVHAGAGEAHPAQGWADSGLMHLVGHRSKPPQLCPVPLPNCADAAIRALETISKQTITDMTGAGLLTERAAVMGLCRSGKTSPGGSCKILKTRDGHIALSLARDSDWQDLPALFQEDIAPDWSTVAKATRARASSGLVNAGRELGFAIADAEILSAGQTKWFDVMAKGHPATGRRPSPRILDLTSLWAGPLCSHILQRLGADVIKVESATRPDGARLGNSAFYDLMNEGKLSVTLRLDTDEGRQQLLRLIGSSDIVMEASRPRALAQLGIKAEDWIRQKPGLTWLSITGYGRQQPQANWIAYGDDAGVAAGLSRVMFEATGQWLIVGDAIADPLTGLHAALAAWASWQAGGGHLIALSLMQTVAHCIAATAPADLNFGKRHEEWTSFLKRNKIVPKQPRARKASAPAAALGEHNHQVLNRLTHADHKR